MRSADGFHDVMIPSRSVLMIASSDDSTIAESQAASSNCRVGTGLRPHAGKHHLPHGLHRECRPPDGAHLYRPHSYGWARRYFQFRDLPDAIHSSAVAVRRCRVSSVFAESIHSTYSRLWLGGNASNAASAFLFFLSADMK